MFIQVGDLVKVNPQIIQNPYLSNVKMVIEEIDRNKTATAIWEAEGIVFSVFLSTEYLIKL